MGVSAGTRTISDGLVLALDAANTRSYPGSGTTWTDLSGRGNNGTLTNGPSFVRPTFREPFGGAGSVYFDGSGDYLTIPQSSNWLYTADYTIEFWLYQLTNTDWCAYDTGGSGSADQFTAISGTVYWAFGTTNALTGTTGAGDVNQWVHWTVTRSGNVTRMFKNGVVVATTTAAAVNIGRSNAALYCGLRRDGSYNVNGYISNLRVINGTALYTQNFTPKRESFVTQSSPYTSLLTCQNGTIRDASPNNFTITRVGNVTPVSYAPYISFDGTDDYVDLPSSNDFDVGTSGDITIEAWINSNVWTGMPFNLVGLYNSGHNDGLGIMFSSGRLRLQNQATEFSLGPTTLSTGQWYHIVAVRRNGSLIGYVNGSVENPAVSNTVNFTQNGPRIGQWKTQSNFYFNGRISGVKIYKGKGLTAAEVSQNYQNTKSRYGL